MSSPLSLARFAVCGAVVLAAAGCHSSAAGAGNRFAANGPGASAAAAGVVSMRPADDLTARTSRIEDLLVGRFPGLSVQRASPAELSVRFRGAEPLIVIDGLEADAGVLASLQPRSVVRIDLLKDPAATGAYGNRGLNGVLVVTTRQGGR